MGKSIESNILIKSKKCGRGSVFFVGDLFRMAIEMLLIRLWSDSRKKD